MISFNFTYNFKDTFQVQSHSKILGVRDSAYTFEVIQVSLNSASN